MNVEDEKSTLATEVERSTGEKAYLGVLYVDGAKNPWRPYAYMIEGNTKRWLGSYATSEEACSAHEETLAP
jgi:hypothetical protein